MKLFLKVKILFHFFEKIAKLNVSWKQAKYQDMWPNEDTK